jgi:hypothetical protein
MSVQPQIEEMPDYLAVKLTGPTKEAWHQYALIAAHCQHTKKNKLLLDFTKTYGNLSLTDRYYLGSKAEIFLLYSIVKVAAVARPDQFDSRRFGEMVAQNRWLDVRLFTNVDKAVDWLLKE